MRSDTELLKELLDVFWFDKCYNNLEWTYDSSVEGLRDCGLDDDIVDELIERRKQL